MPQTRQHIHGERPLRSYCHMNRIAMTEEEIQRFLTAYEGMEPLKGYGAVLSPEAAAVLRGFAGRSDNPIWNAGKVAKGPASARLHDRLCKCLCLSGKFVFGCVAGGLERYKTEFMNSLLCTWGL